MASTISTLDGPTPDVNISSIDHSKPTPVTCLTGYLGSGKTTMILSILKQLKPEYKVVVLKNEFGDVEVTFPAVISLQRRIFL